MLDGTLAKVFGTKHDREIKRIRPLVIAINIPAASQYSYQGIEIPER